MATPCSSCTMARPASPSPDQRGSFPSTWTSVRRGCGQPIGGERESDPCRGDRMPTLRPIATLLPAMLLAACDDTAAGIDAAPGDAAAIDGAVAIDGAAPDALPARFGPLAAAIEADRVTLGAPG